MTNGIRDLAALAADDAAAEHAIDHLSDAELIDLATYAQEWDERRDAIPADWEEERPNHRALTLPNWFWPVNAVLLAVVAAAIVWR